MNVKNLYSLKETLQRFGFEDYYLLHEQLDQSIGRGEKEFELYTQDYYESCKLEGKLYLQRLSDKPEYSFIKYDCLFRCANDAELDRAQTFNIAETGITFKEAFNLLQGRAVYKNVRSLSGDFVNAWVMINFHESDQTGNHKFIYYRSWDLQAIEKVLILYPIRELKTGDEKESLIVSLKAGNKCLVTFEKARKSEKRYIEANPIFKTINISPTTPSIQKF